MSHNKPTAAKFVNYLNFMAFRKTAPFIPSAFRNILLQWYAGNARSLPWVGEKDPYKIWLSEILLQQTRVDQGLPYYLRFIRQYHTVQELAAAPEVEVMKLWEGLGYYNRARNMLAAARIVTDRYQGIFPSTLEGLLELPGIGPYTGRAIAAYAYGIPVAVTDGNVMRVLARLAGFHEAVDQPTGKAQIQTWANQLMADADPALFNQAMMDFGSLVCKPAAPLCDTCPAAAICAANLQQEVQLLPVKSKSVVRKERIMHFLVLQTTEALLIRKRSGKDIWQNLHDFPAIEPVKPLTWKQLRAQLPNDLARLSTMMPSGISAFSTQQLTHRTIKGQFLVFDLEDISDICPPDCQWVPKAEISNFAFPVIIRKFLSEFSYF
jgi:A/G-specific adenine glycosylase